jgi:hypothetical protein
MTELNMDRCLDYQAQMLDYVYDLLDADVAGQLRNHLDVCPHCQSALQEAQGQQQMLAAAARLEFPAVQFTPPAAQPEPEPVVLPMPQRTRRRIAWRRWIAAAALLIALGLPTALGLDYAGARRDWNHQQEEIARLSRIQQAIETEAIKLEEKRQDLFAEMQEKVLNQERKLTLSGAATAQAGAANVYQVDLRDGNSQPVRGKLQELRVVDRQRGDKVLYEEKGLAINGTYRFTLPPNIEARPGSLLALRVKASTEDGNDRVLEEDFVLTPPTYLTHLVTDKPLYQPGDTVRFRSLTLERFSLQPAAERLGIHYTITTPQGHAFEIAQNDFLQFTQQGPTQGAAVHGPESKYLRGIGGGEWDIPAQLDGGEYTLTVSEDHNRFPAQKRKFIVNHFQKPRLLMDLTFGRRSYGPGEEVQASCKVASAQGPVANCKAEVSVQIDGKTYDAEGKEPGKTFAFQADRDGKMVVRFKLPEKIDRGQASVNVVFQDGGKPESLLKPIPIVLKTLDVKFYPEGGYLVPHVPCRVYFEARSTLGKPAELKGRLMDDTGDVVALVQTLADDREPGVNQGMGVFRFTPRPGHQYHLEIDNPRGISEKPKLEVGSGHDVAMSIPQAVMMSHEPIDVHLRSRDKTRRLLVGAYCRGRLFDHARVTAPAGEDIQVTLRPALGVGGVYRVTVFEEEPTTGQRPLLTPVAERLIFRQQRERLNLDVALVKNKAQDTTLASSTKSDDEKQRRSLAAGLIPGDRARLTLRAFDENQEPTPAILYLAVIDQAVEKLADEKTARSMPTHFLLTSEVRKPEELEFADFLLTTHPRASQALDLLLGTQGWRRFAEQQPAERREKLSEEAQIAMASLAPVEVPRVRNAQGLHEEQQSLDAKLQAEADRIDLELLAQRKDIEKRFGEAKQQRANALVAPTHVNAKQRLARYDGLLGHIWPLFAFLMLGGCLMFFCRGLAEPLRRALPYFAAATACAVPAVVLIFVLVRLEGTISREDQVVSLDEDGDELPPVWDLKEGMPPILPDVHPLDAPKIDETDGVRKQTDPKAVATDPFVPPPIAPEASFAASARKPGHPVTSAPSGAGGWGFQGTPVRGTAPGGLGTGAFGLGGGFGGMGPHANLGQQQAGQTYGGQQAMQVFDGKGGEGKYFDKADRGKDNARRFGLDWDEEALSRNAADAYRYEAAKKIEVNRDTRLRQLKKRASDGKEFKDAEVASYFIREYAHTAEEFRESGLRQDRTDTVYWHPALVMPNGKVDVWFTLNQSVTTYQVTVYGHTLDGRVAAAKPFTFDARLPLALDAATPLQMTAGDKARVPVSVANNTDQPRDVTLQFKQVDRATKAKEELKKTPEEPGEILSLKGRSVGRRFYDFQPRLQQREAELEVLGEAKPYAHKVNRLIQVVPEGFPVSDAVSDLLEGGEAKHEITLPQAWVNGTLQFRLQAFPSTLADLQQGLEGLLREPLGCFEQASSANYPNVLILSYLRESNQAKPELERRVRETLDRGYQKLTSYECEKAGAAKREGYEWFGGTAPPHEALTAYGLLQFRDMAKVSEVDQGMLERTRKYLLSRRDGKGGFERNSRAIDTFGRAPDHITNAYIVWALTESGPAEEFQREMDALIEKSKTTKDPYFLALVANSLINRAKTAKAIPLLKKIAESQKPDGVVDGAETSITGSGGRDLQIETTALALLGWLRADPGQFAAAIDHSAKWIGKQRGGQGAFGSTQSTILALKALIAHTKQSNRSREDGVLKLFINGQLAGDLQVKTTSSEVLTLDAANVIDHLKPGKNAIRIFMSGKNQFPYSLTWSYRTLTPPSDPACTLKLATSLSKTKVQEGDSVRMTVKLENASEKGQGMAVAIVGLPAGLNLPEDLKQLRHYKELPADGSRPLISTFEVRGRELILYWRDLAPKQRIEVPIDLVCRVPGEYSGPASRAYLYYNGDHKTWVEPLRISIAPRE